jgi:hypothetical protein
MDLERRTSFDAQKGRSSTFESAHDLFREMIFIFRDHAPARILALCWLTRCIAHQFATRNRR